MVAVGKAVIQNLLREYKVLVVEKRSCPYCRLVRSIFSNYQFRKGAMYSLDIEERSDSTAIQDYLENLTTIRTVPQVFVAGTFIGGAKDVDILHKSGKLETIFKNNSALS